jgi:hypothetical protein
LRRLAFVALLSALAACHHQGDAVLVIVVTASGSPPSVTALEVTLNGPTGMTSTKRYTRDDGAAIMFPTTLSAQLPGYATGTLSLDVDAEDGSGASVASGHEASIMIRAGERKMVYVHLDCSGDPCVVDGGMGNNDGGSPNENPRCGNGRVDPGETCDTAIAAGYPGACPRSCDDHVACTRDIQSGSDCTMACAHEEITKPQLGDGCCPMGATADNDQDCSRTCGDGVVDLGETCDTGIAPGGAGACPTDGDCQDLGPCFHAQLVSAGTCAAVCMVNPVVAQLAGDGCCPAGATHAGDSDCPVTCGDGVLEGPEICDVGIAPPGKGACPVRCDDNNPCTADYLSGSGCNVTCTHVPITAPLSGDGCCPTDAAGKQLFSQLADADCSPVCGNKIVERGEACDPPKDKQGEETPTVCPTDCPITPPTCMRAELVGDAVDCTAHCVFVDVTDCSLAQSDSCCPANCTPANDIDCFNVNMSCGNGFIEAAAPNHEHCDTGVRPSDPTYCPTTCADTKACTQDHLLSGGSCAATCVYLPITSFRAGDGCCPPISGVNFVVDPDCPTFCGNGAVETPFERCDPGVPGSCADAAAGACPPSMGCTRYLVQGTRANCSTTCVATEITACAGGDGCCPAGCSAATDAPTYDSDCTVVCGDGVVEAAETCDRAITAGMPGACPQTCDDGNACTRDLASGSGQACTRACAHASITGCIDGDGCCPKGCSTATDGDCAATCGDRKIGAGETCDPPSTCPTTCPDDGDACTVERLTGGAASCDASCLHVPITGCSGTTRDSCCPTGCTPANDSDCF